MGIAYRINISFLMNQNKRNHLRIRNSTLISPRRKGQQYPTYANEIRTNHKFAKDKHPSTLYWKQLQQSISIRVNQFLNNKGEFFDKISSSGNQYIQSANYYSIKEVKLQISNTKKQLKQKSSGILLFQDVSEQKILQQNSIKQQVQNLRNQNDVKNLQQREQSNSQKYYQHYKNYQKIASILPKQQELMTYGQRQFSQTVRNIGKLQYISYKLPNKKMNKLSKQILRYQIKIFGKLGKSSTKLLKLHIDNKPIHERIFYLIEDVYESQQNISIQEDQDLSFSQISNFSQINKKQLNQFKPIQLENGNSQLDENEIIINEIQDNEPVSQRKLKSLSSSQIKYFNQNKIQLVKNFERIYSQKQFQGKKICSIEKNFSLQSDIKIEKGTNKKLKLLQNFSQIILNKSYRQISKGQASNQQINRKWRYMNVRQKLTSFIVNVIGTRKALKEFIIETKLLVFLHKFKIQLVPNDLCQKIQVMIHNLSYKVEGIESMRQDIQMCLRKHPDPNSQISLNMFSIIQENMIDQLCYYLSCLHDNDMFELTKETKQTQQVKKLSQQKI